MQITAQWLASIQDERGLTNGQKQLFAIWAKRLAFVGFGYLPDQVAHVIETCRGYRGMPDNVKAFMVGR